MCYRQLLACGRKEYTKKPACKVERCQESLANIRRELALLERANLSEIPVVIARLKTLARDH